MDLMDVDGSGDSGLVNSPTRYFALSGLVVHESRWRDLQIVLRDFRRTMRGVHGRAGGLPVGPNPCRPHRAGSNAGRAPYVQVPSGKNVAAVAPEARRRLARAGAKAYKGDVPTIFGTVR